MNRHFNFIFVILIGLTILITGCSGTNSQLTWADVNQEFMELEKERANIMNYIANDKQKNSDVVYKSNS